MRTHYTMPTQKESSYPPPGLAFGEPDDRLQRVSSTLGLSIPPQVSLEYWIIRFRG